MWVRKVRGRVGSWACKARVLGILQDRLRARGQILQKSVCSVLIICSQVYVMKNLVLCVKVHTLIFQRKKNNVFD